MKYDMVLQYVTDTGVDIKVEAVIDGIVIHFIDGDVKNHVSMMAQDAAELSNMLAQASQHVRVLNNKH